MTTICIADKDRLKVRGIENGKRYLVKKEGAGWRIEPAQQAGIHTRQVTTAKHDLSFHLDALASEGFSFEPENKGHVPSCRF